MSKTARSSDEITTRQMVWVFRSLPKFTPVQEHLDPQRGTGPDRGTWYRSQKEHMVGWFRSQATRGASAYTRSVPNTTAKTACNRLQCPPAIVWIAEALSADEAMVEQAIDAQLAEEDRRRQSAAVRRVLVAAGREIGAGAHDFVTVRHRIDSDERHRLRARPGARPTTHP